MYIHGYVYTVNIHTHYIHAEPQKCHERYSTHHYSCERVCVCVCLCLNVRWRGCLLLCVCASLLQTLRGVYWECVCACMYVCVREWVCACARAYALCLPNVGQQGRIVTLPVPPFFVQYSGLQTATRDHRHNSCNCSPSTTPSPSGSMRVFSMRCLRVHNLEPTLMLAPLKVAPHSLAVLTWMTVPPPQPTLCTWHTRVAI